MVTLITGMLRLRDSVGLRWAGLASLEGLDLDCGPILTWLTSGGGQ